MHKREIYASFLAADIARNTGPNAFLCWGVTSILDEDEHDPNYMLESHFKSSPFHQCLHHWAASNPELPLLHIDLHGKLNQPKDCFIDIGTTSMQVVWP